MTDNRLATAFQIGSLRIDPPVLQAPMAGFSNFAYRQIIRRFGGAGLLATEMVSARGLLQMERRCEDPPERLWGVKEEPRPLAVQIWDNDPHQLAEVGLRLVRGWNVSVVDLNFGCPVRDVSEKAQSGSYLLQFPDRIGEIVAMVAQACHPVPVTAKIRLGPNRQRITAVDVAQAVEAAGGAAITIHGRTAGEEYAGHADWDQIAEVKSHLRRLPVIGNGDLRTPQDVVEAFDRYGVDGVMIGRAALGRPWLFRQVQAALSDQPIPADPTSDEQRDLLVDHYRLITERFGPVKGTILMRRYACCYAQGRRGARAFRARVSHAGTPAEFTEAIEQLFPKHP